MSLPESSRYLKSEAPKIGGEIVAVFVGAEGKTFHVHENLLRSSAPYYEAIFGNQAWLEAQTRKVELTDDHPEAFELYSQWLYTNKIWCMEVVPNERTQKAAMKETNLLVRAYCLGEKLLDVAFRDSVIDAIQSSVLNKAGTKKALYPGPWKLNFLWGNSPENSPLRRLILDYYAWKAKENWNFEGMSPNVLQALVKEILSVRKAPSGDIPFLELNTCRYHHHKKDQPCSKRIHADDAGNLSTDHTLGGDRLRSS
ncbi:MAG: hypothetical protein M1820_009041 [Bogoriella megaspora]|nr:MAG: hypothetical protein M1820_009041 [Bogoriella megaspora]